MLSKIGLAVLSAVYIFILACIGCCGKLLKIYFWLLHLHTLQSKTSAEFFKTQCAVLKLSTFVWCSVRCATRECRELFVPVHVQRDYSLSLYWEHVNYCLAAEYNAHRPTVMSQSDIAVNNETHASMAFCCCMKERQQTGTDNNVMLLVLRTWWTSLQVAIHSAALRQTELTLSATCQQVHASVNFTTSLPCKPSVFGPVAYVWIAN